MAIDFEKAFDCISWQLLPDELCQGTTRVLSEPIKKERDCRQGDLIASNLCLIAALLSIIIKITPEIVVKNL